MERNGMNLFRVEKTKVNEEEIQEKRVGSKKL